MTPRGGARRPTGRGPRAPKPEKPGPAAPIPIPPMAWRHPAFLIAALACAASLVISASYRLFDTDLWTLLVTGKAIWQTGAIPRTDQWAWSSFGDPQVMQSWLFRWRIWPLWQYGGVPGLFVWRWLVVLTTFLFLGLTARRLGARGVLLLPVLAWCGLVFRQRSDIRPELVAGVLFALTLWILETVRSRKANAPPPSGGLAWWRWVRGEPRVWLVPIACVWANAHISWYLMFVLWGLYLLESRDRRPWRLVALAGAATFVNPWGWALLAQPFEFAFTWRNERLFRSISELQPLPWPAHLRDGLPVLLLLWGCLAMWRWRMRRFDPVEAFGGAFFVIAAIASQRFLGNAMAFVAPFLARDLCEWSASRTWPPALWNPWTRGIAAAAFCLLIGLAEWTRPELPLGIGIETANLPVAGIDFAQKHDVKGRAINDLHFGGYMTWREWPGKDRLPFMTTQPENARPDDRRALAAAMIDERGWAQMRDRQRFDWALLDRNPSPGERLLAWVAADPEFAPVFMDDAAILFVRRGGSLAAIADSFAYRTVPVDRDRRTALVYACERDSVLRAAAYAEFARQSAESSQNAYSELALGTLDVQGGRADSARAHLERALKLRPDFASARTMLERLGVGR